MEIPDRDQTDDILRENLYPLEIEAPESVFLAVQKKRRKNFAAYWFAGIAAALLLGLFVYQLFSSQKPGNTKLVTPIATIQSTEKVSIQENAKQTSAHTSSNQQKITHQNIKVKPEPKNTGTKRNIPSPKQKSFSNSKSQLVSAKPITETPVTVPESDQTKTKDWAASAPAFTAQNNAFANFNDTLSTASEQGHTSICEQVIIPDSVLNRSLNASNSRKENWFFGGSFTQNFANTQQAYNSRSILVFGDSNLNHDKAINSWRMDLYAGKNLGKHWYITSGFQYSKTRYVSISKAEQENPQLNLSISESDRIAWQGLAAYFDESISYIGMPIEFGYKMKLGKWQLQAGLGAQWSYLWQTQSYKALSPKGTAYETLQDADNPRFNRNIFSIQQKLLASYPLYKRFYLDLGFQFTQNLANTYQADYYGDQKASMAGLQLGMKYYLP